MIHRPPRTIELDYRNSAVIEGCFVDVQSQGTGSRKPTTRPHMQYNRFDNALQSSEVYFEAKQHAKQEPYKTDCNVSITRLDSCNYFSFWFIH